MTSDPATPPEAKPKRKKKRSGAGGAEAERIVKAWLELDQWLVHRAAATGFFRFKRKGGGEGFKVESHDLFGALDLLAFQRLQLPETWALQVTTQSGRGNRRAKISAIAWPASWRVSLVSHETTPDPAHRSRKLNFLKIEDYVHGQGWQEAEAVPIDFAAIQAHLKAHAKKRRDRRKEATGVPGGGGGQVDGPGLFDA